MQACHWKAHNTFTNFYLNDLTWSDNNNNMYLGKVVAAQQVLDPSPQHPHLREEKKVGGTTKQVQRQYHLNAVTSAIHSIPTITALPAGNLAKVTTPVSLISFLAISVIVSLRNNRSKLNIDIGILVSRSRRIQILAKMTLTFWGTMVMLSLALKQTLRVLLKIYFLHFHVPSPCFLNH